MCVRVCGCVCTGSWQRFGPCWNFVGYQKEKEKEKRKASREYSAILTKRTYVKQIKYNRRHDSQVPEKKEKK